MVIAEKHAELTKLDIATLHIVAGIQMIALRANPYSTHLQVMACDEIIETVAEKRNVLLSYGSKLRIKDEHRKEWFAIKRKAYNFFKHADRDADAMYDGPSETDLILLNDITLIMAITGLNQLGHPYPQVFTMFVVAMASYYPRYYKWDDLAAEYPQLVSGMNEFVGRLDRRAIEAALQGMLKNAGYLDLGL